MVWKFDPNDRISKAQLLEIEAFFTEDYDTAFKSLEYAYKFEKYGLPNWRIEILRRKLGLEESSQNLKLVKEALILAELRGL